MSEDDKKRRGPVLIEIEDEPFEKQRKGPAFEADDDGAQENPADAPPIDDGLIGAPEPRTMELVSRIMSRPPSRLTRFFLQTGIALLTFLFSVWVLSILSRLMTSYPLLGWIGATLLGLFALACLAMAFREYLAWSQIAKIDAINRQAGEALASQDADVSRRVLDQLLTLYKDRDELAQARQDLRDRRDESVDAKSMLMQAETRLMAPLDQAARREVEAAARTVAATTALVPLAFVDVLTALAANLRMIRRLAEIYGGRAGAVGGWRLARIVMTHLVATGAVAAGDDLVQTAAGGGILAKLSRRFGEGLVNGALTARVGVAAIEVCRPLPFIAQPRPKVSNLVARGLRGLFGSDGDRALEQAKK